MPAYDIIERTEGNYAKVRYKGIDQIGYRDIDADEKVSQNAFAGSKTQEQYDPQLDPDTGDIVDNVERDDGDGIIADPPQFGPVERRFTDSDSYAQVYKVDYEEPHETGYETPPMFPQGYFIEDYPEHTRVQQLLNEIEPPEMDKWTFGVRTVLVDNRGAVIDTGTNFINHTDTIELMEPAFLTLIEEIRQRLNNSPGNDIIVKETMVRGFEYTEDYR